MKNLTFFYIVFFVFFSSCSKGFLEKPVDNRTLITSLDEMQYTVSSLAPRADHLFTDLMTDDYTFRRIAGHVVANVVTQLLPIYEFRITKESFPKTSFAVSGFNPYLAWRRYYYRINSIWLVLKKLEEYTPKSTEEEIKRNSIKGECLAIKAYCNFMLVNLFAKAQDVNTAEADWGPPFIDKYSAKSIEVFPQQSVKFFYDDIEKSLLEALTLINDDLITNKIHFSTIAIKAFLSRLYLYKKDWDNCIKYSEAVIAEKADILKIKELLNTYIIVSTPKIADYGKAYFDPSLPSSLLVSDNTYQLISYYWSGMYTSPIQQFLDSKGYYSGVFIQTSPLFSDIIPDKWNYFISQGAQRLQTMLPLFTVDECYYNRAESIIQKGSNVSLAKADLQKLIEADGYENTTAKVGELNAITSNEDMLKFLLECKRIRFFTEGMRWFDMKRHKIPISHISDSKTFVIAGNDPKEYVIIPPLEELNFRTYKY